MKFLTEVPPLPSNFTSRGGLNAALLGGVQRALETSGLCGVHGEGGMGKTVATCAFLRSGEGLEKLFPEGVAFATVGQTPHVLNLQAALLRALGVTKPLVDAADGYARLLEALGGRKCLVVLDDVWESAHLEMFAALHSRPKAWQGVVVLFTTRFADLAPAHAGAQLLRLGELTDEEASQLLGISAAEGVDVLTALVKLCARSPLALSILGAAKKLDLPDVAWTEVCKELAALEKAEKNAVKRCIGLAAQRLDAETRRSYIYFAVFPDDVLLPVDALRTIFSEAIVPVLEHLGARHFIRVEAVAGTSGKVRLHDLSLEFVKERAAAEIAGGERRLHEDLLAQYRATLHAEEQWWTGPNDGYFYEGLLHHLVQAGREVEGRTLLLNWEWLWARMKHTKDVVALIADVRMLAPPGALQAKAPEIAPAVANASGRSSPVERAKAKAKAKAPARGAKAAAKAKAKAPAPVPAGAGAAAARSLAEGASGDPGEPGSWASILEVLSLSAHVLAEDERQLPFQAFGRLLGDTGSRDGAIAAIREGAGAALSQGSFKMRSSDSYVGIRPIAKGTLQGIGGPLQRTLQLHKDWVRSIAMSDDGSTLVSGSSDLTVKVWDLNNDCRLVWDFAEHTTAVFTVDILQKSLVISGDQDVLIVWGLEVGNMLRKVEDFEGQLAAVRFLGREHIAVAVGKAVRVLGIGAGTDDVAKCEHEDTVAAIATSEAPTKGEFLLACGCYDHHVVLWRLARQKGKGFAAARLERSVAGVQDVRAVHLAPGGAALVCGNDDASLRVWAGGRQGPTQLQLTANGVHTDWIHSVFISADGALIATGSDDNSVGIYDVRARCMVGRARIFSGAFSVVLSPDKGFLYSASGDIRVWSVPKMLRTSQEQASGAAAPGNSSASSVPSRHVEEVKGLDVSADGLQAASVCAISDEDGKCIGVELLCWDCRTGRAVRRFQIPGNADDDDRPLCMCLCPTATAAAIAADTGKVWLMPLDGKNASPSWVLAEAHSDRITCCQWLDDDTFATGSDDGVVSRWSVSGKCRVASAQVHKNGVKCISFSRDAQRVLSGGDYEPARWTHLGEGRCLCELQDSLRDETSVKTASAVSLSQDERRGVTCSWDQALRLWDLTGEGQLLLVIEHVSEWVVKGFGATLAGSRGGLCVSYTWDRQIQVWDFSEYLDEAAALPPDATPPVVPVDSSECVWKLSVCQCDASLVRMATLRSWPALGDSSSSLRTLAFCDEEGGMHFFEVTGSSRH